MFRLFIARQWAKLCWTRWWYRKYAPGNSVLKGLEKHAREAKKGLWADPRPVPPWEWRKREKVAAPPPHADLNCSCNTRLFA